MKNDQSSCRYNLYLYYSNAQSAHCTHWSSILQLLSCLGVQLDLLLLLGWGNTKKVLRKLTNIHLEKKKKEKTLDLDLPLP